ncbi:MAG: endonuclease/exonuclease/phosphatase family protein [Myxococcota bacterium]
MSYFPHIGARRRILFPVLFLLSVAAPSNAGPLSASGPDVVEMAADASVEVATEGRMQILSYNVAGLPEGISQSRPRANMPQISRLLNEYDLVLAQEDFSFPNELRSALRLAHQSSPAQRKSLLGFGDGLSRFARWPFDAFMRVRWRECHGLVSHGADCLALKGFTVATHRLARGVEVDVYNFHMDAGRHPEDQRAREAQVDQIIRSIRLRSVGRAVILAGDTNMWEKDEPVLARLMEKTGLRDACRELGCAEPWRIDRVLYRPSAEVELEPTAWYVDREFVDADGEALSDHLAVGVDFDWRLESAD